MSDSIAWSFYWIYGDFVKFLAGMLVVAGFYIAIVRMFGPLFRRM